MEYTLFYGAYKVRYGESQILVLEALAKLGELSDGELDALERSVRPGLDAPKWGLRNYAQRWFRRLKMVRKPRTGRSIGRDT